MGKRATTTCTGCPGGIARAALGLAIFAFLCAGFAGITPIWWETDQNDYKAGLGILWRYSSPAHGDFVENGNWDYLSDLCPALTGDYETHCKKLYKGVWAGFVFICLGAIFNLVFMLQFCGCIPLPKSKDCLLGDERVQKITAGLLTAIMYCSCTIIITWSGGEWIDDLNTINPKTNFAVNGSCAALMLAALSALIATILICCEKSEEPEVVEENPAPVQPTPATVPLVQPEPKPVVQPKAPPPPVVTPPPAVVQTAVVKGDGQQL